MPKIIIKKEGFKCFRCGYEWIANKNNEKPLVCARCKSPYWDREKKK